MEMFTSAGLAALFEVIAINVVLSGDNAVVIGLAAAGLPLAQRGKAILIGIIAATVLRIVFAAIAAELLLVPGLVLVGGLLLGWVCWNMWRELREADRNPAHGAGDQAIAPNKTLWQATMQIIVADVSMSLDNVLAVTGAARETPTVLVVGLALSIALMALAANFIARLLGRYHWIAYIGLAIIVYVAATMIYDGALQVWPYVQGLPGEASSTPPAP